MTNATETSPETISVHSGPRDAAVRPRRGPRVRRLHARIGAAHHQAEGMTFSRALLDGQAEPQQLAGLLRALQPGYAVLEQDGPELGAALGARDLPWGDLSRKAALQRDLAMLDGIAASPASLASAEWVAQLRTLAQQAPHRLMAHVYVRYGGDLSGGQQLGDQANAILERHGLPNLGFWSFARPTADLKLELHEAFEQLELSEAEEEELLEEAVLAFQATQRLLAELS